jgi:hypothetical protein
MVVLFDLVTTEYVYLLSFGLSLWEQKTHLLPADGMNATHRK